MSLTRQVVKLMNYNDFEAFLNSSVKLLGPRNFFNQLLNNNSILTVSITWSNFDVEIATEHNALNDGAGCGASLEFFVLTLDFMNHGCLIKFLQQTFSHGALSSSRWPIKQNVGEIVTLSKL